MILDALQSAGKLIKKLTSLQNLVPALTALVTEPEEIFNNPNMKNSYQSLFQNCREIIDLGESHLETHLSPCDTSSETTSDSSETVDSSEVINS